MRPTPDRDGPADPWALDQTLIVAPGTGFAAIEAAVTAAGLGRENAVAAARPLIAGEPELAVFTNAGHKPMAVYTFNPVAQLRVLDVATTPPPLRARIATALDLLGPASVAALLGGPTPRDVLRGLWAARATERIDLIAPIAGLAAHGEPVVAREAARVGAELERIATARHEALVILGVIEQSAAPVIARLHAPDFAATLCPTAADCARLFDADIAPSVARAARDLYAEPIATSAADPNAHTAITATTAGMLRWPNERSRLFPRGYRAIAGWMEPAMVWLTWALRTPSGGAIRYDGLAWVEDHWVWLPKAYRLLAGIGDGHDAPRH